MSKKKVRRKVAVKPVQPGRTRFWDWCWRCARFWGWRVGLILLVVFAASVAYLDISIRQKFEGQKWALPAHVYTRPMELYIGQRLNRALVEDELKDLGYQLRNNVERVGSYRFSTNELAIHQREFQFWDGLQPQQLVRIQIQNERIRSITTQTPAQALTGDAGQVAEIIRLEPRLFGSVSPLTHEDRTLLKLEDAPPQLVNALIAIEDQQFYSHFGINPMGIARALVSNIAAGKVVQGGSTLTQQLVKNYYLNSEQTIRRKLVEMVMAMLLEIHYSKREILQAYLNEVHLSQAGNRAIHGFALGSQHFFARPLQELDLHELATLAGVIKGPSFYNPLKWPERAKQRRNLVLKTMHHEGFIDDTQYQLASEADLRVNTAAEQVAPRSYPSFLGFVRQGLQDQYQQQDIYTDGLQIYTTLNPRIQQSLETAVQSVIPQIEKDRSIESGTLQVAAVVIRTDNGEVAAMVGDRKAKFSGYNRALQARRPVGSLIKPFVYLTALEQPERFSLASRIDDTTIEVSQRGSPVWRPQNYDGEQHGSVMMIDALAQSYNMATVRLGMELGVDNVVSTLRRVGYSEDIPPLPSVLLGSVPMSVLDVGQLYLAIASGGFKLPVKGIRSVLSKDKQPLARFPLAIEQVIEPEFNILLTFALQEVVRNGTANNALRGFHRDLQLAGKTGTTNDWRDSWFVGFSGNYLTVVWVGRDDNQSTTRLTGAAGAARVWASAMQTMALDKLDLPFHENVIAQQVVYSLEPEQQDCSVFRVFPVLRESLPLTGIPCEAYMQYDSSDDQSRHFETEQGDQRGQPRKRKKTLLERIFGI